MTVADHRDGEIGPLGRQELFADTEFAEALALAQRPATDIIDLRSIIDKLQQIMRMTME